jgi:hypothetical protein
MKKTVSLTEVQLKDIINRVVSEQLKDVVSSVASSQNNTIALCADLGVKTVGYCDTKAKKPIKSCAEMGIKTPGFCYVDTKQPVPGMKKSTNTIKEQASQVASALKPAMVTKPQGGQIPFNPTHIGGYEVDCKSKQVKLNTKNKVFLKPEAKALIMDAFCNPKYRATGTPSPVAKQTGVTPTPAAKQTAPTSTPSSTGSPSDFYGNQ